MLGPSHFEDSGLGQRHLLLLDEDAWRLACSRRIASFEWRVTGSGFDVFADAKEGGDPRGGGGASRMAVAAVIVEE